MTDTIEVVLTTITDGRMNHAGIHIESPGMDVVSQRVCILLNHIRSNVDYKTGQLNNVMFVLNKKNLFLLTCR